MHPDIVPVRIVLADDSAIVRAGVRQIFDAHPGFAVIGEARDAEQLQRMVALERPDIAIVDIRMPPTYADEGVQAAKRIGREHPGVGVLVLSQYVEAAYALELLAASPAGARLGYLLKDRVLEKALLIDAVQRVQRGELVVDSLLVESLLAAGRVPAALAVLSHREREVLALMAQGLTDRGIADRLHLSPRTVGTHIQRIFDGLGISAGPADNRRVLAVLAYLNAR